VRLEGRSIHDRLVEVDVVRLASTFHTSKRKLPQRRSGDLSLPSQEREQVGLSEYRSIDVDAGDVAAESTAVDAWIDDGGINLATLGPGGRGHVGMNESRLLNRLG
jgi:hypothetical protein